MLKIYVNDTKTRRELMWGLQALEDRYWKPKIRMLRDGNIIVTSQVAKLPGSMILGLIMDEATLRGGAHD